MWHHMPMSTVQWQHECRENTRGFGYMELHGCFELDPTNINPEPRKKITDHKGGEKEPNRISEGWVWLFLGSLNYSLIQKKSHEHCTFRSSKTNRSPTNINPEPKGKKKVAVKGGKKRATSTVPSGVRR